MKTSITCAVVDGSRIWSVHFYSQSNKWIPCGQFDTYAEAVKEAESWEDGVGEPLHKTN